jgi:hypothetical protein
MKFISSSFTRWVVSIILCITIIIIFIFRSKLTETTQIGTTTETNDYYYE